MSTSPALGQDLDGGWERLDPRMLFVHPIRELLRFLPALVGLFVAGTASGGIGLQWQLLAVAVPLALGLMRYLTTSFRVTADRVELRRGLVSRHLLSTRLDRVRTVDLSSSPIQRVLGLSTVRIGTGTASTSDDAQVDLDGLRTQTAQRLRADLQTHFRATAGAGPDVAPAEDAAERVIVRLDPAWARFAPLTSSGVVLGAAALGIGSQILEQLGDVALGVQLGRVTELPVLLGLTMVVVLVAGTSAVLAVGGYFVTNWDFRLSHTPADDTWHLSRGLLTTRETSVDGERVAGVTVGEPIGLRMAGGARLSAIVTGLDRSQQGSSVLVPPAPQSVVRGVGIEVLGVDRPLTAPLVSHGPAAARRRYARAVAPSVVLSALLVTMILIGGSVWLLVPTVLLPVAAAALAADRVRSLGHLLIDGYVVARSGSLYRQRQALAVDDVIGWTFRATWFQRRVGLTSLVATTAGGPQSVTILDAPEDRAVDLAATAMPALLRQFAR